MKKGWMEDGREDEGRSKKDEGRWTKEDGRKKKDEGRWTKIGLKKSTL
jgi:hypothetical protein